MQFERIPIAAATVTPDPRSAPASVPDTNIRSVPMKLHGTDQAPGFVVFALEGTAGQSAVIECWYVDEPVMKAADYSPDRAALKWYRGQTREATPATSVTVTVGQMSVPMPAYNGRAYYRVTTAPAAAATLLVGYLPGGI